MTRKEHLRLLSNVAPNTTRVKDDPKLWVKSPFPDVPTVLGVEMHEMIFQQITKYGDLPAMTCGVSDKTFTFNEIYRQSRGLGAALIRAGFKRGDVVGLVLPNIPEFPIAVLGCWSAGLTVSCINPAYTEGEIKRQLASSDAKVAITIEHFLNAVRSAKSENPRLSSIIIIGDAQEGCHTFSEMAKSDTNGIIFSTGENSDTSETISLLPYSSGSDVIKLCVNIGTTGPPKGVLLSHSNITTNLTQFSCENVGPTKTYHDTGVQERLIGLLPFFHSYGMAAIVLAGLYQGAHSMSLPSFDPATFLKAIREHKPTCMHLVTPLISHMVNSDDYSSKELEHCHTIVGAAAPIGNVLINQILEKAGRYIFFAEGYGMTELSPLSHLLTPSSRNSKIGSCGTGVPSTWSKVIDLETGETLPQNTRGELLVKGPQVMKGYFRNEEATRNTIDSDGWLHTGDIAYYDEDGYFYIVDRLKELIKVKGFQVAPSELEDLLRKHEKVEDVAVIGVPNLVSGEAPRAYIVPKPGTNPSEEEINEYLKPLVASFKRLYGGIEFRKTIPKAPSGKILRRELSDEYRKQNE
ncbi:4-coumarate--CoA ligase 1 [Orchesella cincta]|uniref:4-coumarate--CoA ligase 1 n=1 Tax=Orchesella cincta TaxID=48709 RepID=A0A1D2MJ04_ORCCI|nr:4-coumarate--CoA ligase 1 [Orchesella cincta]